MFKLTLLSFLITLLTLNSGYAQETNATAEFQQVVVDFQKKDHKSAGKKIDALLINHPHDPTLLFNKGVNSFYLGEVGIALGALRQAARKSFWFPQARNYIEEIYTQAGLRDLAYPTFFNKFPFYYLRLEVTLVLTWLLFTLSLWKWVKFSSLFRSNETDEEINLPKTEIVLTVLLVLLTVVGFKQYTHLNSNFATITIRGTELKTIAKKDAPALVTLPEGLEVKVIRKHKAWLQVTHPNFTTGWINNSSIFRATGATGG